MVYDVYHLLVNGLGCVSFGPQAETGIRMESGLWLLPFGSSNFSRCSQIETDLNDYIEII